MSSYTIKKGKLIKKGDAVEITYSKIDDAGGKSDVPKEIFTAPIHGDLLQAFENLAIHLAVGCGYVKPSRVKDIATPAPELTEGFHVSSVSIGGDDDAEGFVISGHCLLPEGKAVILNTPFRRFEENEQSAYRFIDDVREKIDRVILELRAYMEGRKRGTDPQGKLNFDAGKPGAENLTKDQQVFKGAGIGIADPDAMARVAEMDNGQASVGADGTVTLPPAETGKGGRKRKPQTPDNPAGAGVIED